MKLKKRSPKYIITRQRDLPITKSLLKKKVLIYNGNKSLSVELNKNLVGNSLGSLALTKKMGKTIHDSERNRKRKNKKKQKK